MAEKHSLKLKYLLKYSLELIYLMSDNFDFFIHYFIFNIARLVIATYLGSTIIRLSYLKF